MSSASKALGLLSLFSASRPEMGLSQLCRIAKRDKATTYRHLQTLEEVGFVEQNPANKCYRLGPALLHLANVREETVPRKEGARLALQDLADMTGETAHASVLSGTTLFSLMSCESPNHGTRAVIDITTHPLHATASGICALAFGPDHLFEIATADLAPFTDKTPTSPQTLSDTVAMARDTGFGRAKQTFESDIHGISVPIFDSTGFAGTVSVASVASRFTPDLEQTVKTNLIRTSRDISHNWGGKVPPQIEAAWTASIPSPSTLKAAS